jgi:predicted MFS family arabinose efflux permease
VARCSSGCSNGVIMYGTGVIGLFGLAGAAGAVMASIAGRLADRGWAQHATMLTGLLLALSWIPIWAGTHHLTALLIGIVVLDLGAQGLHITNQSEIYRLDPAARSRLTCAYMTAFFTGGAAGSAASAAAWHAGGWTAVAIVGAAFSTATLLVQFTRPLTTTRRAHA